VTHWNEKLDDTMSIRNAGLLIRTAFALLRIKAGFAVAAHVFKTHSNAGKGGTLVIDNCGLDLSSLRLGGEASATDQDKKQ
jgi:hypothetical protein